MKSQMSLIRFAELAEIPVVIMSMSMNPVFGSVALCCIAVLIRETASSTSLTSTVSESRILAIDSETLIIDSSCLGVAVIVFYELPRLLIFVYSLTSALTAESEI